MSVEFMNVQQQQGGSDCGVFAIAFATSLVFWQCMSNRPEKFQSEDEAAPSELH